MNADTRRSGQDQSATENTESTEEIKRGESRITAAWNRQGTKTPGKSKTGRPSHMPRLSAGLAATPLLYGELLKCGIVGCVALGRQTLRMKKVVYVLGKDGADGMDRFVSREASFRQTL